MAKKVEVSLVDDIDGSIAAETVGFALDGASYEIDLSDKNASQLRDALAGYVAYARREGRVAGGRRRPAHASNGSRLAVSPQTVRAWAAQAGLEVSDRGRIPLPIMQQYQEAMQQSKPSAPSAPEKAPVAPVVRKKVAAAAAPVPAPKAKADASTETEPERPRRGRSRKTAAKTA